MKGLLDPVKNAKTVGRLFILGAIITIVLGGMGLLMTGGYGIPPMILINFAVGCTVPLAIGIGLIKKKVRAIYLLFFLSARGIFRYVTAEGPNGESLFWAVVYIILSIWFWSAKDQFSTSCEEDKSGATDSNTTV